MKLAVTIDVEEDGLFTGNYPSENVTAENVRYLEQLDGLFSEHGIRPTLLVSFHAADDERRREILARLAEKWRGEIGAHLHPWNTPPLTPLPHEAPVPSELIPVELLRAKMAALVERVTAIGSRPASFRMGRFNMGPRMFSILEDFGIRVDSSISPTRVGHAGPDHLAAPVEPYFPDPTDPCNPGDSPILEVPITIAPITRNLGRALRHIRDRGWAPAAAIAWFSANLGSLPAQPMWTGIERLKAAVRLHRSRGGEVLTTFFHSSEIMPGGCPRHPTQAEVDRFLAKLDRFFLWLRRECSAASVTLSELRSHYTDSPSS